MTKRELAALACKVLALWVAYRGILWLSVSVFSLISWIVEICLSGFYYIPLSEWSGRYGAISALPGIVAIGAALLFWQKADSLAARMVPDDSAPSNLATADPNGLLAIAIVVLGVVLIVFSLPVIIATLVWPVFSRVVHGSQLEFVLWNDTFWGPAFRLALGVWLVCGTRGVVRIISKARTMGLKISENEVDSETPSES